MRRWADEISDSEPLPQLEAFFILAALEFGDPDLEHEWLIRHASDFHRMYRQYRRDVTECGRDTEVSLPTNSANVIVQYLIWYPREASKLSLGRS